MTSAYCFFSCNMFNTNLVNLQNQVLLPSRKISPRAKVSPSQITIIFRWPFTAIRMKKRNLTLSQPGRAQLQSGDSKVCQRFCFTKLRYFSLLGYDFIFHPANMSMQ